MRPTVETITVEIQKDVQYIRKDVDEIKDKLERMYVTHEEFEPIKKVVYGMVATMLLAVLAGILKLLNL